VPRATIGALTTAALTIKTCHTPSVASAFREGECVNAINTSHRVLVLGDRDTGEHLDMLGRQAAVQGAVIDQAFCFAEGEAAAEEDLSEVEAVVAALGRAIGTHTNIWLPFPVEDLRREQHFRRLSLALQRHGLNLLLGKELTPCPVQGGYNEIDAALRAEVRAVDGLDLAALAAAGVRTLGVEIEMAVQAMAEMAPASPESGDGPEVDDPTPPQRFSTAEVADYLGKSPDWISRGLRTGKFSYSDGSMVVPIQSGRGGRRSFTVAMIRAIAWSGFRRGALSPERFNAVLERLITVAR